MILSTTPTIEGHPILEYKGIVTGETIIGANQEKRSSAPTPSGISRQVCGISLAAVQAAMRKYFARQKTQPSVRCRTVPVN